MRPKTLANQGLSGKGSIAELCCKEGIAKSVYYTLSKEFQASSTRRLPAPTRYGRHAGCGTGSVGLLSCHRSAQAAAARDNGPSYIAGELDEYIEANKMSHVRGAPMHPQTQGKIERWHQALKNRILLEN